MDCLEFRRRLGSDPQTRDPEFLAHRDSCRAGCAESWRRAQRFERRVMDALKSIETPPDLAERVLLAQATSSRARTRRFWQIGLAAAAALLVALVVAGYAWNLRADANGGALAGMAIAHVRSEAYSLTMSHTLRDRELQSVFADRGLAMRGAPTHAVFAADCRVGPYKAVHLVLREGGERVTALYVLGHRIAQARDFHRAGWRGRELPMGAGTLVLLGNDTGGFAAAERAVAKALLGSA
ncbi:MAG TPA: DUF3379 family protein [Rhodanobacteraceae bacterium]|nr:DUF3379 family protein [Rhodanobacteraceae bacterium]